MRISDPKLFNGQTLATKQQISAWLAGTTTDNGFGILSIPASNVKYGTNSNVSAQIEAIYAKLGLDNTGTDSFDLNDIITSLSNIKSNITVQDGTYNYIVSGDAVATNLKTLDTNLKTVSGNLDVAEAAISTLTGAVETSGSVKYEAKAAADSALADAKAYTDALASGRVATAESEIDAIQAQLAGLSQTTVVEYVEGVSGTLQGAIDAVGNNAKIGIASQEPADSNYAMVYTITQGGTEVGKINIPKDQYLSGVEYDQTNNALVFNWKVLDGDKGKSTTSVKLTDLIEAYQSGNKGIVISGNTITLQVAKDEKYLEITENGIESKGIDEAIDAAVSSKADSSIVDGIAGRLSTAETTLSGKADTNTVNDIAGRLSTAETTLSGKADQEDLETVSGKLEGISDTVSGAIADAVADKAKQEDLEAVSDKLVGITGTVSSAIDAAVSSKADSSTVNGIDGRLTTAENTITTLTGSVEVSGSVKYEAADAAAKAVSDANAKLAGITDTVSGAIEAAKTAVISEVKLVEQTLTFNNGKATVTTAGRVLQVFDSTGVCWPDITYSEAGIATINIGTDAESTTGYSAVIVKKTNIDIAE